jgi:competence ComEA-like helix-hairpin-helix protein
MKRIIKDYFSFSKKERIAVILLLLLMGVFMAAPYLYVPKHEPPVLNKALFDFVAKGTSRTPDSIGRVGGSFIDPEGSTSTIHYRLFSFDPNTATETDWNRLGVYPKTIRTIFNYRNKGGHFRSAEDIRKIWGLKKEQADRLVPYVRIAGQEANSFKSQTNGHEFTTRTQKPGTWLQDRPVRVLDINTATAEDWKSLPGIGEVLANRIVKFRERLGGFSELALVKKTYGISDSVFRLISPYLKADASTLAKIDLNTASAYDLRIKADIPDGIAKAIIIYRQQNGPFQSIYDLKKVRFIADSLFEKLILRVKTD